MAGRTLSLTNSYLIIMGGSYSFFSFDTYSSYHYYIHTSGRVAMLAVLGHIVTTAGVRLPGDIAFGVPFSSIKTGIAVFNSAPAEGLMQVFLFVGVLESGFAYAEKDIADGCTNYMNNIGWSAATQRTKSAIELSNGRAAMMGIRDLMVHEGLNNDPYVINGLLGYPVAFNAGF